MIGGLRQGDGLLRRGRPGGAPHPTEFIQVTMAGLIESHPRRDDHQGSSQLHPLIGRPRFAGETMSAEIETFLESLERAEWLALSGRSDSAGVEAIYDRHQDLFDPGAFRAVEPPSETRARTCAAPICASSWPKG